MGTFFRTPRGALALIVILLAALLIAPVQAQGDSGQIAITGRDGNIHLYAVDTDTFTAITNDADPNITFYAWPTWANDGQLAYFGVDLVSDAPYRLGIFVQPVTGDPELVYSSPNETFTYAYWSPGECPAGGCRDLAVLYTNARGGLAVRNVRAATDGSEYTVTDVAEGAPFYWDWSPDGRSMFWARFGRTLEIYDVAQESITTEFEERQGFQRAVDWSPIDNRLLTAVREPDRTSSLVILKGKERLVLAEGFRATVTFEWSPDGSKVAYADSVQGVLSVVDSANGNLIARPDENVLAFFWSPDATKIAYITVVTLDDGVSAKRFAQESNIALQWNVYDLKSDSVTRLATFIPTQDMIYYLRFFDQFARSHRLWSPDSRYLVYGELESDNTHAVQLLDITQPSSAPVTLMEGEMGVFSW